VGSTGAQGKVQQLIADSLKDLNLLPGSAIVIFIICVRIKHIENIDSG
jgi:hypothetical protein